MPADAADALLHLSTGHAGDTVPGAEPALSDAPGRLRYSADRPLRLSDAAHAAGHCLLPADPPPGVRHRTADPHPKLRAASAGYATGSAAGFRRGGAARRTADAILAIQHTQCICPTPSAVQQCGQPHQTLATICTQLGCGGHTLLHTQCICPTTTVLPTHQIVCPQTANLGCLQTAATPCLPITLGGCTPQSIACTPTPNGVFTPFGR
jgi:hypothetical protein